MRVHDVESVVKPVLDEARKGDGHECPISGARGGKVSLASGQRRICYNAPANVSLSFPLLCDFDAPSLACYCRCLSIVTAGRGVLARRTTTPRSSAARTECTRHHVVEFS